MKLCSFLFVVGNRPKESQSLYESARKYHVDDDRRPSDDVMTASETVELDASLSRVKLLVGSVLPEIVHHLITDAPQIFSIASPSGI